MQLFPHSGYVGSLIFWSFCLSLGMRVMYSLGPTNLTLHYGGCVTRWCNVPI